MLCFFFWKGFPTLATLTAVSDTTITTLRCMKITSRNLQFFCYDYFEDLLASITFAKNFGFLAGVVSKIFAEQTTTIIINYDCQILNEIFTIEKSIFCLCMIGKSYLLH